MGKDREGKFHPKKGKPSGSGKDESTGLNTPLVGSLEQYLDLADKYTTGADEMPANVRVRHPNRNVNKGEDRNEEKKQNRTSYKSKTATFTEDRVDTIPVQLPGILTKEMFADLANYKASCGISVYLPTHRAGVEVNEQLDNIAFKNALQNIASSLKDKGFDQTMIQKIIEPGYDLLRNDTFWRNQSNGLAVFMADGFFKYVQMPVSPQQELIINNTFYLKPLVPVMTTKEYFYLLVLSKKEAKFYKCDAFGILPIPLSEMPNGVEDVVHFEEKEDQKLFRSESSGAGKGANFHGHGGGRPDPKEHLALYLEEVDDTLWEEILNRETAPLLLAGVEYLLPIYKSVSNYNFIWDDVLTGNYQHEELHSLYAKAREKMEPYFKERTKKALEGYANQSATPLTSSVPDDVIPAAHYGRVWHLFVQKHEHIWGKFDEMSNDLKFHKEKEEGDECLLDKAVIKTILNGGDVHFLPTEDMPANSKIAALMRY